MMEKWLKQTKNEKGLTLVELLAVVVILGIIAAIAVPSIGGIIDNSKKDAHVANAQQMVSSARLAVTGNPNLQPSEGASVFLPLAYLENNGYVEEIKSPDNELYVKGDNNTTAPTTGSYVEVIRETGETQFKYSVRLYNSYRGVQTGTDAIDSTDLNRDKVNETPTP
ncbi:type II secretion system protein [Alkalihalophilus marmarensis]|nr:type II secretion system protein [Alkalihalophilus marmarensis]MEC2071621.1 type II secretion system protein [Alkalihalophilus marmarensis]